MVSAFGTRDSCQHINSFKPQGTLGSIDWLILKARGEPTKAHERGERRLAFQAVAPGIL